MDLKELNRIAEEIEDFIVGSNGIEIYRISSSVTLKLPREFEEAFHLRRRGFLGELLQGIIIDVYLHAVKVLMKKYSWIEGLNYVDSDGVELRTDYPVLDLQNKLVPDPEEAEKRLRDLKAIQDYVNGAFREGKKHMAKPGFTRKHLRIGVLS